jgi:PPK2 family polyphosphate:nucleotide phosphotransferase
MPAHLDLDRYRVHPGKKLHLKDHPTDHTAGFSKDEARAATAVLHERLAVLQEMLYAQGRHRILIVAQGMDTAGKDGLIRGLLSEVDPQGVRIANFKAPTPIELSHDFLWRVHQQVPTDGELVLFNRSHYEDVLIVRVKDLVPEPTWRARYEHIRAFERLLVDEGTTIIKFFLHLSKDEQRARLQARLDDPAKHWKFNVGDLGERKLWDDYMAAYRDALAETSTQDAPWYVIPADHKWFRDLLVARIVVDRLEQLGLAFPKGEDLSGITID